MKLRTFIPGTRFIVGDNYQVDINAMQDGFIELTPPTRVPVMALVTLMHRYGYDFVVQHQGTWIFREKPVTPPDPPCCCQNQTKFVAKCPPGRD